MLTANYRNQPCPLIENNGLGWARLARGTGPAYSSSIWLPYSPHYGEQLLVLKEMESLIECYLPPQLNSILRLKKKEWWRDRKMVFLATWMPYHPPHLHCYHHSILWYRRANRAHWSVCFCNSIRLEIINNKTCTWAFFPLKRELNGLVQTSVDLAACYPCNMPNDRSQSGNWISWVPAPRLLSSLVWFFLSGHIKKFSFLFISKNQLCL